VPYVLVAITRHRYVFADRLLTVIGDPDPRFVPLTPPSLDVHVAWYEEILVPPGLAGGPNATFTLCAPAVTDLIDGAPGRVVFVITVLEDFEYALQPDGLRVATLQEYALSSSRWSTMIGELPFRCVLWCVPSIDVHSARYPVTCCPPLASTTLNRTSTAATAGRASI
jgi:hypothetical protein